MYVYYVVFCHYIVDGQPPSPTFGTLALELYVEEEQSKADILTKSIEVLPWRQMLTQDVSN